MRSEICIFNIETNETEVVASTDMRLEAPNWSPDDKFLILNGEGMIFRVDFAEPNVLQEIDTDFAIRCNASHSISPDGATLAFSQGAETSIVYTVSTEGGTPTRITIEEPTYVHGWSPDGQTLAYSGRPSGPFQIFTIAAEGGEPVCLTEGAGHKYGPEFTPDGKHIWFNSDRGGRMDLWRMGVDGTHLEQMTRDGDANWFAHPSPDGAHVLYLACADGQQALPDFCDVILKLMPSAGGEARDLISFTGGRGTIDGPCWAPDAKRFAFMRYATA